MRTMNIQSTFHGDLASSFQHQNPRGVRSRQVIFKLTFKTLISFDFDYGLMPLRYQAIIGS